MRLFITTLLFLICLYGLANADVYVITNPQNGVYSISDQNDAVLPKGYTLTILKGQSVSNLPITGNIQLYNFINGAFIINATAVQAQQAAQQSTIAQQTAQSQLATNALSKINDAISRVATQDTLTQQELAALASGN